MIKKFTNIKTVGRFLNSASKPNPQISKVCLISGYNGYGKSTLCSILRSFATGDPDILVGRKTLGSDQPQEVLLLLDSNLEARFNGSSWSKPSPPIAIFDGTFIAQNVYGSESVDLPHKRNLYRIIVGATGVDLLAKETELSQKSRSKTSDITDITRKIQDVLPDGMTLEQFKALKDVADIDNLLTDKEHQLSVIKQTEQIIQRPGLKSINLPKFPAEVPDLLIKTLDSLSDDTSKLLQEHMVNHGMSASSMPWLSTGLSHITDTCPFCGQLVEGLPLIGAYKGLFSDVYADHVKAIDSQLSSLSSLFGEGAVERYRSLLIQNRNAAEFWAQHCSIDIVACSVPDYIGEMFLDTGQMLLKLLQAKRAAPLEAISPAILETVREKYEEALSTVRAINGQIALVDLKIQVTKDQLASTKPQDVQQDLDALKATKARHTSHKKLCENHTKLVQEKRDLDKKKEKVRADLEKYTATIVEKYQAQINRYLESFNAGFAITQTKHTYTGGTATSQYRLEINSVPIDLGDGTTSANKPSFKNTLSAGDKTTLALAFFLAHLTSDQNAEHTIAVFDDPFNSQDAFRRRQTVFEILKVSRLCKQVFVLSHDATFLKLIWDKVDSSERSALAICDHGKDGSRILQLDIESATKGRTASDIDDLQQFCSNGQGKLADMARKMRVVLETYFRTTYPAEFREKEWLGDMVGKIRDGGGSHPAHGLYDEVNEINDFSKDYHHGENLTVMDADELNPVELRGYVLRTLKIVNALQA